MSHAPILQVDTLSRHFPVRNVFGWKMGAVRALDGVSFEVRAGETLGIVGESGCGKSTLGKTLVGIHPPGGGRIVFEGQRHHRPIGQQTPGGGAEAAVLLPGSRQFARPALDGSSLAGRAPHRAHRAEDERAQCAHSPRSYNRSAYR